MSGLFESGALDYGAFLSSIIKYNRCRNVVEIGVAFGSTTKFLCEGLRDSDRWNENPGSRILYGFDIWKKWGPREIGEQYGTKESVTEHLKKNNLGNFELYNLDTTSEDFKNKIKEISLKENNLDFVFIDGDHSYQGVKNDFDIIYPLLSKNGIVAFHDTYRIDGCREFVLDLRTKYYDGTYDIVNMPWGFVNLKYGLSLLFKRGSMGDGMPELWGDGSISTPKDIIDKEIDYINKEKNKNVK